ncbi:MAG: hypothetical protein ACC657_05645 [Thiohalomonadales bacterium]
MHTKNRFKLFSENEPRIGIIIGTGFSLTIEQIQQVRHLKLFGINKAYQFDVDVMLACNSEFWDHYWFDIAKYKCHKWTPRLNSAKKYNLNYIEEVWQEGLSTNNNFIHAHHGSGPQILNIALHYGVTKMALIGWDMRYPGKISDRQYEEKRHYFGEYPKELQHWPRTSENGNLSGLIREVETIKPHDYGIEIINCTKDSALTCFPYQSLSEFLKGL